MTSHVNKLLLYGGVSLKLLTTCDIKAPVGTPANAHYNGIYH